MTIITTALLSILQSILASAAYNNVKNIMYADDGSDNDAFRKVMREAFVAAVKKTKKDANDFQIEKTEREEFRYYQKVIIDEIVHLEPTDKKKYINQDLYIAFKDEVMKRQDALSGLNLALAQECVKTAQENESLLTQLLGDVNEIKDDVKTIKGLVTKQPKTFKEISTNLRGVDRYLADDYHIERQETTLILRWVHGKDYNKPEERICIVTGEAGCGKTVVLADVLNKLEQQDIPTIGLKTDYLFDINDTDIDKALNLNGTSLIQIVEESAKKGLTVLIIDQIDALSLSLTFKRKPLAEVQRVITELSRNVNVRIVLSCREYDYKSERAFYRYNGSHQIIVRNLSRTDVDRVLADFNFYEGSLQEEEYRFLENPMNLSLYCRLRKNGNSKLKATQSVVYDAYWQQILIADAREKGIEPNRIKSYLEIVVGNMIHEQVLSQSSIKFSTDFSNEQKFLLSEGFLAQSSDGAQIQFRHQTLFDYTYSRLFFESGRTIEDDFLNVHQGLFVRGRLKTLLVYLRDVDSDKYISTVETIIFSTYYRFHLKQLTISLLGSFVILKPQEEAILCETIIPDKNLCSVFLRTVYATGPVKALMRYILSNGGFANCEWRYAERVIDLLNYIIDQNQQEGIAILRQIEKELNLLKDDRLAAVVRTICYLSIKDNKMADTLLSIIKIIDKEDGDIGLHHFYANLAVIRPDIVADRIKRYVAARLSEWDSKKDWQFDVSNDLRDMLHALAKANAHLSFKTEIDLVMMMIEASILKLDSMEIATTNLYWHYNRANDSFNFPDQMMDSVLLGVEVAVEKEIADIDGLLNDFAQKKIDICHVISITGWLKNIYKYKDVAYEYLYNNLNETGVPSVLEFYQVVLFGKVFLLLDIDEQSQLVEKVRNVVPEWEKGNRLISIPKEKRIKIPNTARGTTKGKFLNSIPDDYLKQYFKDAWKELEEIRRKGLHINNEAPNKIESHYGWSTVPTEKLEKMTVDDYVKQAEKYKTDYDVDWSRPTRVGLAWSMRDVLKEDPDKGYEVYKKIIENGNVDLYYVSSALSALQESGISERKITDLYTSLIGAMGENVNDSQGEVVIDICRSLDYYINNHMIAPKVLMDYVMKVAREANDSKEVDYADVDYNTGINQVRGCAVDHLVRSITMEPYTDEIFKCLDDIADTASVATRCAALFQMAMMMHGDKERTLRLFLHLVHDYNVHLLRLPVHSMNPILYLISYNFEALKDYFEHCIDEPLCHKENVVWLLIAAIRKKEDAEDLLYRMADASEKGRTALVHSTKSYYNPSNHELMENVLRRYMDYDEEELGRTYDAIFEEYYMWPKDALTSYLDTLFDSKVSRYFTHFVYEFLENYAEINPHKTLYWLLGMYFKKEGNWRVFDSMTEVLLAAYNRILEFDKGDKVLEDAMDMLDAFLQSEDAGLVAQVSREIANV